MGKGEGVIRVWCISNNQPTLKYACLHFTPIFLFGMFEWKNNNTQFANRNITKFYLDNKILDYSEKKLVAFV